jgi:asparagine synthetase B (glutamine-hydrolysing)
MCGFVITQNKNMVVTMLERQGFRGPDLMHFWADEKVSMGHALLDISG